MRTAVRLRLLGALTLVVGTSGCVRAALQYDRDGLAPVDRRVRSHLEDGRFGSAYEASFDKDARARDRLLRNLSAGTLGFYANRTDSSVWALDRAWTMTEDRYTKKLSDGAGSLLISDYLLPYVPGATERLFIPFYGALSWLARGNRDDAAVEARRLTQALGEASDDSAVRGTANGDVRGLLHYVAGAVFEASGERTDADVAYRNAARLIDVPVQRDSAAVDSLSGDVVVVLEQGFVGHPVPRSDGIWVSRVELDGLRRDDRDEPWRVAQSVRYREGMRGQPWMGAYGGFGGVMIGGPIGRRDRSAFPWHLSVSWSEFTPGRGLTPRLDLAAAGTLASVHADGNVSAAVREDFERGQPARFARALVRAAARATLMKAGSDQMSKALDDAPSPPKRERGKDRDDKGRTKSDDTSDNIATAVRLIGAIGLYALAATSEVNDVGDVRSWNLLPHDLRVIRLRLPAGDQDVRAIIDGREVLLGRAHVVRGGVTVLAQRFFTRPLPSASVAGN